jgi:hypothetical protein
LDEKDAASETDTSATVFVTLIYMVPLKGHPTNDTHRLKVSRSSSSSTNVVSCFSLPCSKPGGSAISKGNNPLKKNKEKKKEKKEKKEKKKKKKKKEENK